MKTHYCVRIGRKGAPSSMMDGGDNLAELLAKLADSFAYYRLAADWHDMTIHVGEYCSLCRGSGVALASKKTGGWKRCPDCKGSPLVSESSAEVPPMSETTCLRIRGEERAKLAQWEAERGVA